ncbi:MAG TPA: hypothetical protein VFH97_00535, partial [Gemmatimonadales bacterium]|nr:hypothetical protein [Gemmatimonadales bacterium]
LQPALELLGLSATTTTLTANDLFQVRVGTPNGQRTGLTAEQTVRVGGAALTAAITSSNPAIGQLVTDSLTGGSVVVGITPGEARSPGTVAAGGVELAPLADGVTTVAASIPGFVLLPGASVTVDVNTPAITPNPVTVGAGLQENAGGFLGAAAPTARAVSIKSSNPGVARISRDASTPGADSIEISIVAGASSFGYYVQGMEGARGDVQITVVVDGYTQGIGTASVVQPALELLGLGATTSVGSADDLFQVRVGVPNTINTGLSAEQAVRAGAPAALTATVTNGTAAVGQLVISTGATQMATVSIGIGVARSPVTIAGGGVAFHGTAPGTTTVAAVIPGFFALPAASVLVTVTP